MVKADLRELVPIFSSQTLVKYEEQTFKGLDLSTQKDIQGGEIKHILPGKVGIASRYD